MMIVWKIVNRIGCQGLILREHINREARLPNYTPCRYSRAIVINYMRYTGYSAQWRYIQDTLWITYPQGHMHRNTSGYVSDNKPTAPTMTQYNSTDCKCS